MSHDEADTLTPYFRGFSILNKYNNQSNPTEIEGNTNFDICLSNEHVFSKRSSFLKRKMQVFVCVSMN